MQVLDLKPGPFGFRVALRRRAGLKIYCHAEDGLQRVSHRCNLLAEVLRLGAAVRKGWQRGRHRKVRLANTDFRSVLR